MKKKRHNKKNNQTIADKTNQAIALHQKGEIDKALETYLLLLKNNPNQHLLHYLASLAYGQKKLLDKGIEHARKAISLNPNSADYQYCLGNHYINKRLFEQAIQPLTNCISLNSSYFNAWNELGVAQLGIKNLHDAENAFLKAYELNSKHLTTLINLSDTYVKLGNDALATAYAQKALQLEPGAIKAYVTLAGVESRKNNIQGAIEVINKGLSIGPDMPILHFAKSMYQLVLGDFKSGWTEYEWRFKFDKYIEVLGEIQWPRQHHHIEDPIDNKKVLVFFEQGFGDSIQFFRYLKLLKDRGCHTILHCQEALGRLFEHAPWVDQVIAKSKTFKHPETLDYDVCIPIMSLPYALNSSDEIPCDIPYITPAESDIEGWRQRISSLPGKKVGIVWSGNPNNTNDIHRTIPSELMLSLLPTSGVTVVNLQKGVDKNSYRQRLGNDFIDYTDELNDFYDTSALVSALDLVITVDTAVAHLCGALGVKTWTLIQFSPDWRWQLERKDSPWYPTMRLFRQPSYGNWDAVIAEVKSELERVFD